MFIIPNDSQLAVINFEGCLYYSSYQPAPREPHSAVTQLIQGLYESNPDQARKVLRSRIFANYKPGLLCRGMIAMAAKRFQFNPKLDDFFSNSKLQKVEICYTPQMSLSRPDPSRFMSRREWLQEANRLTASGPQMVRAILVDATNTLLAFAESSNNRNRTHHAEVLLLQSYYHRHKKGFSSPHFLITSLQCCKMCAAMAWHCFDDPWNHLKSIYLKTEKGPSARDTIFTKGGNLRREITQNSDQIHRAIEELYQDTISGVEDVSEPN